MQKIEIKTFHSNSFFSRLATSTASEAISVRIFVVLVKIFVGDVHPTHLGAVAVRVASVPRKGNLQSWWVA